MDGILFSIIMISTILLIVILLKLHKYIWYRIKKGYISYLDFIPLMAKHIRINRLRGKF